MKRSLLASIVVISTLCVSSYASADVFSALKNAVTKDTATQTETTPSSTSSSFGIPSLDGLLSGSANSASLTSSTASNAAGILQYCIKNNVLSDTNADSVKNKLLSKIGLQPEEQKKDESFQDGLKGILRSDSGTVDLSTFSGKLKEKATTQACDFVLKNAKSFL